MNEIKTDLFPDRLRAARERARKEEKARDRNSAGLAEPLPESVRPRKDGPGGE